MTGIPSLRKSPDADLPISVIGAFASAKEMSCLTCTCTPELSPNNLLGNAESHPAKTCTKVRGHRISQRPIGPGASYRIEANEITPKRDAPSIGRRFRAVKSEAKSDDSGLCAVLVRHAKLSAAGTVD